VVVEDPAFAALSAEDFTVHTRWIETEWNNTVQPFDGAAAEADEEQTERQTVVVEVGGRRLEVSLPGDLAFGTAPGAGGAGGAAKKPSRKRGGGGGAKVSGDAVTAPMQGTIIKVAVADGDTVAAGDLVVVLEAMKMENPVTAHKDGTITGLSAEAGASITQGSVLCEIKDS
jgi:acetyl-CoA/propionyl-CoA carboxylase, biotin carboxylase, biotin carboxyl carrier protein